MDGPDRAVRHARPAGLPQPLGGVARHRAAGRGAAPGGRTAPERAGVAGRVPPSGVGHPSVRHAANALAVGGVRLLGRSAWGGSHHLRDHPAGVGCARWRADLRCDAAAGHHAHPAAGADHADARAAAGAGEGRAGGGADGRGRTPGHDARRPVGPRHPRRLPGGRHVRQRAAAAPGGGGLAGGPRWPHPRARPNHPDQGRRPAADRQHAPGPRGHRAGAAVGVAQRPTGRLGGLPVRTSSPARARAVAQARPTRLATISADIPTRGRPPPGWADPPTRNRPGTGEAFWGRRNAALAPFDEVP